MRLILSSICLAALLWGSPCLAEEGKEPPEAPKQLILETIQKIVKGVTLQDRIAKNLGFTIKPTKATVSVSF